MIVNKKMTAIVEKLQHSSVLGPRAVNMSALELSKLMLRKYHNTRSIRARMLIRDYMKEAGEDWQARLKKTAINDDEFAPTIRSLDDYVQLVAASDPSLG